MFKTHVEPWAAGECFHCKVLMSILWLIRVSTMEKCWFFFNSIDRSLRPFPAKFLSHSCRREKEKKSCHHHIISIICILIDHSFDQSVGRNNCSISYCKDVDFWQPVVFRHHHHPWILRSGLTDGQNNSLTDCVALLSISSLMLYGRTMCQASKAKEVLWSIPKLIMLHLMMMESGWQLWVCELIK